MTNCVNIIFSVFNYMNIAGKNLQEISFTQEYVLLPVSNWIDQDWEGKANSV